MVQINLFFKVVLIGLFSIWINYSIIGQLINPEGDSLVVEQNIFDEKTSFHILINFTKC